MSTSELLHIKKNVNSKIDEIQSAQNDFAKTRATRIKQAERVLSQAVERLKVSMLVPKLLNDPKNVKRVLQGTQYERAIEMVARFTRRRDIIVKEQLPPLKDHGLIKIIDYFQRNYQLYELFPEYIRNLTREERKLIMAFEMLRDIGSSHLWRTAKSELIKERKLHGMYMENEKIKDDIALMKEKLHKQRVAKRWQAASKEAYLQKYIVDLMKKKWENSMQVQSELDKCSRIARASRKICVEKHNQLEEELEKMHADFEKKNHQNLKLEKDARAEKNKLLLQLQGLLKKYDTSIGEKMRENLVLKKELEVAKKELDDYMVYYRREEAIYIEVVVKREDEERRQHEQRMLIFMMNRAARKIQKYWIKWRKDQRKKNRQKGKK